MRSAMGALGCTIESTVRENVRGKNGRTAEFLVAPVSRLPDLAEGTLLGEDDLGIKHGVVCIGVVFAVFWGLGWLEALLTKGGSHIRT
jgi:hypothetical protein